MEGRGGGVGGLGGVKMAVNAAVTIEEAGDWTAAGEGSSKERNKEERLFFIESCWR